MHTEMIDLNIAGIEFSQCIVDMEYERSDNGALDQPAYGEDLTIYRVQIPHNDSHGHYFEWWTDLQEIHFHLIRHQALDWIHAREEQSKLDKQIEDLGL